MAFDTGVFSRYQNTVESPTNALMRGLEIRRAQQGNALQDMQMQALMQRQREAETERQRTAAIEAAYRNAIESPLQQANALGMTRPTPANAAALATMQPRLNQQRLAQGLASVDPMAAAKLLTPAQTKIKDYKAIRNADGSVSYVGLTEDGRVVQTGQQPFEKPEVRDFGGTVGGIDPITGRVTTYGAKTMTPGERDASARGWAAERRQAADSTLPTYDAASGAWVDRRTRTVTPAVGPDGKPVAGKAAGTVEERNAAGYASRMSEATKLLDAFESDGRPTYWTNAAGGLPFVGDAARTKAMTPEQQQYRQAQEDWVRAKLRKESGAAIGADEMDREIKAYFPQPGELAGVVEQKRRARLVANEAMQRAAGRAVYASEVPANVPPRLVMPGNPNAGAMDLFNAADAIINGGK